MGWLNYKMASLYEKRGDYPENGRIRGMPVYINYTRKCLGRWRGRHDEMRNVWPPMVPRFSSVEKVHRAAKGRGTGVAVNQMEKELLRWDALELEGLRCDRAS